MKISEYNQMMSYLTRPGQDSKTSTGNISSKHSKTSSGLKNLAKHNAMMKRVITDAKNGKTPSVDFKLAEAGFESSIPDALSKGKKIMVDRSSATGFTTMDPQDFNDVNKALNKYRRPDDQLKVYDRYDKSTYPSDPKQREKLFEPILDRLKKPKRKIKIELQDPKPSLDMYKHIQEVKELKEQSEEAERRFREISKPKIDPDMYGGLAYLMGLSEPKGEK